mgnify:CR=1 FL=1
MEGIEAIVPMSIGHSAIHFGYPIILVEINLYAANARFTGI